MKRSKSRRNKKRKNEKKEKIINMNDGREWNRWRDECLITFIKVASPLQHSSLLFYSILSVSAAYLTFSSPTFLFVYCCSWCRVWWQEEKERRGSSLGHNSTRLEVFGFLQRSAAEGWEPLQRWSNFLLFFSSISFPSILLFFLFIFFSDFFFLFLYFALHLFIF